MSLPERPLTVAENALFARWEEARGLVGNFIRDGVPYPERYLGASVRVLLVLKEPYSAHRSWDMRDGLRDRLDTGRTWDNASRWVEALQRLPSPPSWDDVARQDTARRRQALGAVAVINLKKVVGGARTRPAEVTGFVRDNREYLREQIALYRPDVTLLCGTAPFIGELIAPEEQGERQVTEAGSLPFRSVTTLGCMIRFVHPQSSNESSRSRYERLAAGASEAWRRHRGPA